MSQPSNEKEPQVIIVKKRIIKKEAHHGGSWKIAYADFVTAMMAFFLLMWLLSMLNKYQLMGISNYFNKPLKNVFVDNKKNDLEEKKIPDEDTKKYKLQLISKEKVQIDARSRGDSHDNGAHDAKQNKAQQRANGEQQTKQLGTQDNAQNLKATNANEKLKLLKEKLEHDLSKEKNINQYKEQVNFNIVKDGLKITLHDLENKPMFSLGKADFELYAKPILKWLTREINHSKRKMTIIGYTDTYQYPDSHYSNWELSVDRANATRRVLIKYGMKEDSIIRIQGAADLVLLDKKNGQNSKNRRIELILLNDEAIKRLMEN